MQTRLLDYSEDNIKKLVERRNWKELSREKQFSEIYYFVKDEILFGYSASDNLKASEVLKDGYGQCNTKATLLMGLYSAVGIETRLRAFYVDKEFQKQLIGRIAYKFAPKEILHTWVEVLYRDSWIALEGVIIDSEYLAKIQRMLGSDAEIATVYSYAIATENINDLKTEWNGLSTYIQKDAIIKEIGVFNSPDELYTKHKQKLSKFQEIIYTGIVRKYMNRELKRIRANNTDV